MDGDEVEYLLTSESHDTLFDRLGDDVPKNDFPLNVIGVDGLEDGDLALDFCNKKDSSALECEEDDSNTQLNTRKKFSRKVLKSLLPSTVPVKVKALFLGAVPCLYFSSTVE